MPGSHTVSTIVLTEVNALNNLPFPGPIRSLSFVGEWWSCEHIGHYGKIAWAPAPLTGVARGKKRKKGKRLKCNGLRIREDMG